ncbi:hypothetical protein SAMN06309944_1450 [Micrococcales bacterium KH10]|nr:hypothetical protein SAMN06309944_1450 [Micrococcales bacterium KH10]
MYKHVFDLRTGACLDTQNKPYRALDVWRMFRRGDDVHVLPPTTRMETPATTATESKAAA